MAKAKHLAAKAKHHAVGQHHASRLVAQLRKVNWNSYFDHIKSVCPWSSKPWRENKIEIAVWDGTVEPLNGLEARVYACSRNRRHLKKLCWKLNTAYEDYEWLWSEPKYGEHAAPVPCLIQQHRAKLESIRQKLWTQA